MHCWVGVSVLDCVDLDSSLCLLHAFFDHRGGDDPGSACFGEATPKAVFPAHTALAAAAYRRRPTPTPNNHNHPVCSPRSEPSKEKCSHPPRSRPTRLLAAWLACLARLAPDPTLASWVAKFRQSAPLLRVNLRRCYVFTSLRPVNSIRKPPHFGFLTRKFTVTA